MTVSAPNTAKINWPFSEFVKEDVDQTLGKRFREQVRRHAARPAVVGADRTLTYAELDRLSDRVARRILTISRAPTARPILLWFDHEPAMVVAILGALKAGTPYIPLDLRYPPGRIAQIVEDSRAELVFTSGNARPREGSPLPQGLRVVDLNMGAPGAEDCDVTPGVVVSPDHIAYVLYTSGSTGAPKGVTQTHRNVLSNIRNYTNDVHISHRDRLALITSFSFAASVSDLFGGLLNGAAVCLYDLHAQGVGPLVGWLEEQKITIYYSVPSVYRAWVSTLEADRRLEYVRVVKLGGDRVTQSDLQLYRDHFNDTCVLQVTLGATEINLVCRYLIDHRTSVLGEAVPVGYPPDGVDVRLIDDAGCDVAPGEVGTLEVRSAHLSPGYWNSAAGGAYLYRDPGDSRIGVYRTGDIGRRLPDGCLIHLGRSDGRAKVQGQSVELFEVEAALLSLDAVRDGVVVNRPAAHGEARLVAYLVAARDSLTAAEVRYELTDILPAFMVPTRFVFLDVLPLNVNGKVDRHALPDPDERIVHDLYTPPTTDTEKRLWYIWSEILDVQQFGIDDAFRELGGDSLQAMRVTDAVNRTLQVDLTPRVLIEAETIRRFARFLVQNAPDGWSPLVPIKTYGAEAPLFMVHALDGHVLGYVELADCLPARLPLYGFEARGLRENQEPSVSIATMATAYLDAVRRVQPHGPYRLGGFSLGGLIAYEMACQARRQGDETELLLIGDAWTVTGDHFRPWRYRLSRYTYPFSVRPQEWRDIVARKLGLRSAPKPERRGWGAPGLHERVTRAHKQAAEAYRARCYPGRVTLLRSQEYYRKVRRLQHYFGGPAMGWDRLAQGGVDLHFVPGRHFQLFGVANAERIASIIKHCLANRNGTRPSIKVEPAAPLSESDHK